MNFRFPLFVCLLCCIFLAACTSNSETEKAATAVAQTPMSQPKTFSNFYVRYLEDAQELKAEATFKIGDSLQTATAQAIQAVSFEGKNMERKDLGKNGIRYRSKDMGKSFKGEYLFNAQIDSKTSFDYPISVNAVNSFSIKGKQVQKSKGVTIRWEGQALSAGELLVVFFINPDKKPVSFTINGPTTATEVVLEAKNLARLQPGKGSLRLIRKSLNRLEDAPKNIESVIEYYTKPIDIQIAN